MKTSVYLYAIRRDTPWDYRDICGIEDAPIHHIGTSAVQAVISHHYWGEHFDSRINDMKWLTENALRHDQVIAKAFLYGTVLPIRFGTLFESVEEIENLLHVRSADLINELTHLEGRGEWSVNLARSVEVTDQPMASVRSGRDYLTQRRSALNLTEERRNERAKIGSEIHNAFAEIAEASVVRSVDTTDAMFAATYLIENSRHAELAQVLSRYQSDLEANGYQLRLTGPWAPFHFTPPLFHTEVA